MLLRPLRAYSRKIHIQIMASAQAAAGSSERQAFAGTSTDDLAQWLAGSGIPIGSYGQGSAKSVAQLW